MAANSIIKKEKVEKAYTSAGRRSLNLALKNPGNDIEASKHQYG